MERTEPKSVRQILQELFKEKDLEDELLMRRAMAAWPEVVGPVINRLTVERRVARGVLSVRVVSAPVRSELALHRTRLLEALNRAAGRAVLTEIRFL